MYLFKQKKVKVVFVNIHSTTAIKVYNNFTIKYILLSLGTLKFYYTFTIFIIYLHIHLLI